MITEEKNQRWEFKQDHGKMAWNIIKNVNTHLCLTTQNGKKNAGTLIVQDTCKTSRNYEFEFRLVHLGAPSY